MALSTSSCIFFTSKFAVDSHCSSSVKYSKAHSQRISATYATAERTAKRIRSSSIANASHSSLYEVLGIQIGADKGEIKAAYRRLARVLHPDVGNRDSSADEFMRVHSAYSTLSDPGKREEYDRSLFGRNGMTVRASSPVSFTGYSGRRWETDQCW